MSVETIETVEAPTRTWQSLWRLSARGAAWVLLACCVVLVGTILLAGEREASVGDLQAAIAQHEVSVIEVDGTVRSGTVHWNDGVLRRVTETGGAPRLRVPDSVFVVPHGGESSYGQIGQWHVPDLAIALWLCISVGTIALLIVGREPWRATRWAWFWLLWPAPPLGALAFLLLGGSTWQRPPVRPARRLTGGWALLISLVGVALVQAVVVVASAVVL
jgi:hypothetical protein